MRVITDTADGLLAAAAHYLEELLAARDFSGAVKYYEANRRQLETAGSALAGRILRLVARAHLALASYPTALRLARMAQAIHSEHGDTLELAETFLTVAEVLRDSGELKQAEKAFRDAESIFRRNDCAEGQSRALNLLAGLYFRQNDYRNSLTVLMEAIGLAKRLDDRKKLAYMMGNIGRIQTFLGEFAEAKKHLEINLTLSEELGQTLEAARAALSLGYVQMQEGDFAGAETTFQKAAAGLRRVESPRDQVILRTYLGELYYRSERAAEAAEMLESALAAAEAIGRETTLTGRVLRHLAEASLRVGHDRVAARYAARALAILAKTGEMVEQGAVLKVQAILAERGGRIAEARELFVKALDTLHQSGVRFEKAEALVAAGQSAAFDPRKRLTCLFRAEEYFRRGGMQRRLEEIDRLLAGTDRLRPGDAPGAAARTSEVEFLTANEQIKRFKQQLSYVAKSDLPVLLTGETGVGKDHMARYFHAICRPDGPFVAVNCASIPETLLESELFGYAKGAFTGADRDKEGLFVTANGGVLYLDEIGDMPPTLQAKLLGVLESRRVVPVGSTKEVPLDIRLVVATNRDLQAMVERGLFRRDLYYRISGITFHLPPLRDRKEDIPLLLRHFLQNCRRLAESPLPADVIHRFVEYAWPGNVRELKNKVKRLEVMAELAA
ncbi:MAG TPA: sigma 54-interacting transcriptional regulator, partial [candidate division Zixibacteria bacterium]|nr:sigma 54-interacting transcriptional regulator [candidate division Zixibacteria bacterium]